MNAHEEVKLVLLMSLDDLRGQGSKCDVLDNIAAQRYYKFTDHELMTKANRPELVWRNGFAWVRKTLVGLGYMDDPARNRWTITQKGRIYLANLCSQAVLSAHNERLTPYAIARCRGILDAQKPK